MVPKLVIDVCFAMRCNTLNSWVPRRNQGRKASSALPQGHVAAWSWQSGQAHLTRLHVAPPPGVEVKVSRGEELVFVFRVVLEVTEFFVIPRLQLSISGRDWATTAMTMASSQWGQVRPAAATCGFFGQDWGVGAFCGLQAGPPQRVMKGCGSWNSS